MRDCRKLFPRLDSRLGQRQRPESRNCVVIELKIKVPIAILLLMLALPSSAQDTGPPDEDSIESGVEQAASVESSSDEASDEITATEIEEAEAIEADMDGSLDDSIPSLSGMQDGDITLDQAYFQRSRLDRFDIAIGRMQTKFVSRGGVFSKTRRTGATRIQ